MILRTSVLTLFMAAVAHVAYADLLVVPSGPDYPAPGGNGFSFSGDLGGAGGRDVDYTGFDVVTPGLVYLWQGLWEPDAAVASLDGSPHALSFDSVGGGTATWIGTTSWTDPDTSIFYASVPLKMEITINSGPVSWEALPKAGFDFPAIGAVLNNSSGGDYQINVQFTADTPVSVGYVPLDSVNQSGGGTLSSISLGFYSVVPEPSTFLLAGVGLAVAAGYGLRRRRRRA